MYLHADGVPDFRIRGIRTRPMSKGKDHIKLTEAIRLAIKWAAPETIKVLCCDCAVTVR